MNIELSHNAASLSQALESPIYNNIIKKNVGDGSLDYEVYLNTKSLLQLQLKRDGSVPDELLFQITHQTQELWLKYIAHEGTNFISELDHDNLWRATGRMDRIVHVQKIIERDIYALHALTPSAYQGIRRNLGNGSGQESPGYNQIQLVCEEIEKALDRLLARRDLQLIDVYESEESAPDLQRICEQLVDFDCAFQGWLTAHFLLVRRTIGIDRSVKALDGFPTHALAARMVKPIFQKLWDVRVDMTQNWKREGGVLPGHAREEVV